MPHTHNGQTGDRMAAVGVMSALGLPDVGAGATTGKVESSDGLIN